MKTSTVTIIGLDQIGLSIAAALKKGPMELNIVGHDKNQNHVKRATLMEDGPDKIENNLPRAAAAGDIIILSLPFTQVELTLQVIADDVQEHTLVIDLSKVKGPGLKWAQKYLWQGHYIGARPIFAADQFLHESEYVSADLFKNSAFCVTPSADVDPKAVETAVNFGRLLGAQPYFLDPMEYDSLVQGVETLPGLLGAAMFSALHKSAGWRDILRFADRSFAMTTSPLEEDASDLAALALNDKLATLRWLTAVMDELKGLQRWIYDADTDSLAALLESMQIDREQWLQDRKENDWIEGKQEPIAGFGLGERMLGSFLQQRVNKKG